MVQIKEPNRFIKIGFKDGELVCVDWTDMIDVRNISSSEERIKFLRDVFDLAKIFVGSES